VKIRERGKKGDAEPEPEPEQTQAISQPLKREREISAHKYFPIEQAMQFIGFHFSALNLGAATPFPHPHFTGLSTQSTSYRLVRSLIQHTYLSPRFFVVAISIA